MTQRVRDDSPRGRTGRRFPRFDRVERVVHWCNATLFAASCSSRALRCTSARSSTLGRAPARGEDDPRLRRTAAAVPVAHRHLPCRPAVSSAATSAASIAGPRDDRRGGRSSSARERAAREVQSGSEAQRDLRRRNDRRDADDRFDHALVQAVLRQLAHRARRSCTTGSIALLVVIAATSCSPSAIPTRCARWCAAGFPSSGRGASGRGGGPKSSLRRPVSDDGQRARSATSGQAARSGSTKRGLAQAR